MATGASTAQLAIVLVDARKGVLPQSRRHAFIASLLGIPHVVVAVNKMDLVDYSEEVFTAICADFREFARDLDIFRTSISFRSARWRATTSSPSVRARRGIAAARCCTFSKPCRSS